LKNVGEAIDGPLKRERGGGKKGLGSNARREEEAR